MISEIEKRDGRRVNFEQTKILNAISRAMTEVYGDKADKAAEEDLSNEVTKKIEDVYFTKDVVPSVEQIQDIIEETLIEKKFPDVAKAYILYREKRSKVREMKGHLMTIYQGLTFKDAADNDLKRENANIDGDTAMGTMLRYGSEGAKWFNELFCLKPEHAKAHIEGDIHIHDLDFLTLTMTCCQIDLLKLFKGGFYTGHGTLREPTSIRSAASLACIAIQSNQNDQHGGQSVPAIDYYLAPYVAKSFEKSYKANMQKALELIFGEFSESILNEYKKLKVTDPLTISNIDKYIEAELDLLNADEVNTAKFKKAQLFAKKCALKETEEETHQAMEAMIHNLNTMQSRAGSQTPFSSINFGTDTTPEGRMVIRNILRAIDEGLGKHETSIFPVSIFKVKEGINYNKEDPNYDLFEYACIVSSKRLFPNFSFIDAPFNLKYYKPGDPNTEIAYMGCVDYDETIVTGGYIRSQARGSIGRIYDQIDYLYNHKDEIRQMLNEEENA